LAEPLLAQKLIEPRNAIDPNGVFASDMSRRLELH